MTIKQRWANGETTYGVWSGLDDTVTIQILGRSGFDFVSIDLQHSFATIGTSAALLDALDKTGSPALVRVPWNTPDIIMRTLDLGAEGVIVPLVNNVEEAKRAADACRYAPAGNRSWGPMWQDTRTSFPEPAQGDAVALCIAMIETKEGLENLDAILGVDGLHGVYIGPNDLSLSMGWGRQHYTTFPKLHEAIEHIIARTKAAGKIVGFDCSGPEQAHYWRDKGMNFLISAKDSILLGNAAKAAAEALRR